MTPELICESCTLAGLSFATCTLPIHAGSGQHPTESGSRGQICIFVWASYRCREVNPIGVAGGVNSPFLWRHGSYTTRPSESCQCYLWGCIMLRQSWRVPQIILRLHLLNVACVSYARLSIHGVWYVASGCGCNIVIFCVGYCIWRWWEESRSVTLTLLCLTPVLHMYGMGVARYTNRAISRKRNQNYAPNATNSISLLEPKWLEWPGTSSTFF